MAKFTFQQILADHNGVVYETMRGEHSDDIYLFIQAVEEFKHAAINSQDVARFIVQTFIDPNGERNVNISEAIASEIAGFKEYKPDCFDEVQEEAYKVYAGLVQ